MTFPLLKRPCRWSRVLEELHDSSFADGYHALEEYPLDYDPMYYPQYHRSVFRSPESVAHQCLWGFSTIRKCVCIVCERKVPGGRYCDW